MASKERKECARDFRRFAKKILDGGEGASLSEPSFGANTTEAYFRTVYHSDQRSFQTPEWLPVAPSPHLPFDERPFTQHDLEAVIKRSEVRSSPSPLDQVPYLVFKRCPSLGPALLDLFNTCWRLRTVPPPWKKGVIRLIPKADASDSPHLPSKDRWLQFMVGNDYLDTSVQKAFLPNISGCLEQYQKLQSIIKDAHYKHRSLSVCWLDLVNAYGSVHHQLISCCLQHYHAPPAFLDMIANLYTGLSATITSQTWSTKPVPLEIGVYQGDPLSVVIFNTVMSTLSDGLRAHRHLGYTISGTTISTNVLLYADDTCLVADGPARCQHLLTCVEQWLHWTGMAAKVYTQMLLSQYPVINSQAL